MNQPSGETHHDGPDLPDGYQIVETIEEYTRAVFPHLKTFPEWYAARGRLMYHQESGLKRTLANLRHIASWLLRSSAPRIDPAQDTFPCDAVIFSSSRKPSLQPALDTLADSMAHHGYRCAVVTPQTMYLWSRSGSDRRKSDPVKTFSAALQYGFSVCSNVRIFLRSLKSFFFLLRTLWTYQPSMIHGVIHNPTGVWYELMFSMHRQQVVDSFLARLKPRGIVVNGEHPPVGTELLLSRHAGESARICFYTEQHFNAPLVSDEVWVWNQTLVTAFTPALPEAPRPPCKVIGNAQIEYTLNCPTPRTDEEESLFRRTRGRPVLVFLTEFDNNPVINTGAMTQESMRWLGTAARRCPDWFILIKSRPYHHEKPIPGLNHVLGMENVLCPGSEINLNQCLNWSQVRALAACGSTGLYVAAGAGRVALRLRVSKRCRPLPIIDEVSIPIHSPEQLADTMRGIANDTIKSPVLGQEDRFFPYRGRTTGRMTELCLQHLRRRGG